MIGKYAKSFPSSLNYDDANWTSFINKLDEIDNYIRSKIEALDTLLEYDRCPAEYLDHLGHMLYAGIKQWDDETTKRKKIRDAIQKHKLKSTWKYDAKLTIDAITGYDARIISAAIDISDDSIEMAQQSFDPDTYWSTEGAKNGGDAYLGTLEIGYGTELYVAGNIYINCHYGITTAVLTQEQIDQIVYEMLDVIPAYMYVYLGYLDSSGVFQLYSKVE